MALIERFEDILGWQEARKLVGEIYQMTNSGGLARDFGGLKHSIKKHA